jgi:hypothetical protein
LFPPGISVVADKMRILFKGRIIMSRQHLAMRININAGSLGLLEKLFQVF